MNSIQGLRGNQTRKPKKAESGQPNLRRSGTSGRGGIGTSRQHGRRNLSLLGNFNLKNRWLKDWCGTRRVRKLLHATRNTGTSGSPIEVDLKLGA